MIQPWFYETDKRQLKVELSLRLYPQDVIVAAVYVFTDRCFIFQRLKDEDTVELLFEVKPECAIPTPDIVKEFANVLIDQQLRHQLNHEFGAIRDAIVQRAFAPVSQKNLRQ